VDILIDEVMWPNQALGRHVVGSKETVAGIDREMMLSYLSRNYVPGTAVVSIAGDLGHEEALDAVADALGDWPAGEPGSWLPSENRQDAPRMATVSRKIEQSHIYLAVRGLSHLHPDRFALDLLNVILGEGMSSRLFLEVRERRGLAYDIHSHASYFRDTGSVCVYAGVDQKNVRAAIESILQELVRVKDEWVPEAELVKAKELSKGHLALRFEDTRNVAGSIGGQELLTDRIRGVEEIVSMIEKVTVEDLRRVSRDLFDTSKLNLAMVGPVRNGARLERLLKL
jgi:predicted Zn-dependent peptidase